MESLVDLRAVVNLARIISSIRDTRLFERSPLLHRRATGRNFLFIRTVLAHRRRCNTRADSSFSPPRSSRRAEIIFHRSIWPCRASLALISTRCRGAPDTSMYWVSPVRR